MEDPRRREEVFRHRGEHGDEHDERDHAIAGVDPQQRRQEPVAFEAEGVADGVEVGGGGEDDVQADVDDDDDDECREDRARHVAARIAELTGEIRRVVVAVVDEDHRLHRDREAEHGVEVGDRRHRARRRVVRERRERERDERDGLDRRRRDLHVAARADPQQLGRRSPPRSRPRSTARGRRAPGPTARAARLQQRERRDRPDEADPIRCPDDEAGKVAERALREHVEPARALRHRAELGERRRTRTRTPPAIRG